MEELPGPVKDFVHELATRGLYPAYLGVRPEGRLLTWGGHLERYGIDGVEVDTEATEVVPFLEGLLPLAGEPFVLSQVQIGAETYADVHLFSGDVHDWVVMLDCSEEACSRQLMQQRGNELALLRDVHARIMDQFLGKKVASDLAKGLLKLKEEGERRVVTVLFADVRGSTSFAEKNEPEVVFRTLNLYLRAMVKPILSEAGMVDKLIGDGVMAIFGLLPSTSSAETLAVRAAMQMMDEVAHINSERVRDGREALWIGAGIATGPAVLGILGSKERRAFSALGHHVNLAARLEGEAGPGEILVDENTFGGLIDVPVFFDRIPVKLKGVGQEVVARSYRRDVR